MEMEDLVFDIAKKLVEYNTQDVKVLEINNKSFNYLVLCTAEDNMVAKNIAYNIKEHIKINTELQCFNTDGFFRGDWIVIDYKDIVIHIFTKEARTKYNLEKLWKDKKLVDISKLVK